MSERRRRQQNRRARRRDRRPLRADTARRHALQASRQQGCVCEPHIVVRRMEGVSFVQVAHDDYCPLLRAHEGTERSAPLDVLFIRHDDDEAGAA